MFCIFLISQFYLALSAVWKPKQKKSIIDILGVLVNICVFEQNSPLKANIWKISMKSIIPSRTLFPCKTHVHSGVKPDTSLGAANCTDTAYSLWSKCFEKAVFSFPVVSMWNPWARVPMHTVVATQGMRSLLPTFGAAPPIAEPLPLGPWFVPGLHIRMTSQVMLSPN